MIDGTGPGIFLICSTGLILISMASDITSIFFQGHLMVESPS